MSTLQNFGLTNSHDKAYNLHVITPNLYDQWHANLGLIQQNWLAANNFIAKPGATICLQDATGSIDMAIGVVDAPYIWDGAKLEMNLPRSVWQPEIFENCIGSKQLDALALGWGLSAYKFNRYRDKTKPPSNQLLCSEKCSCSFCKYTKL